MGGDPGSGSGGGKTRAKLWRRGTVRPLAPPQPVNLLSSRNAGPYNPLWRLWTIWSPQLQLTQNPCTRKKEFTDPVKEYLKGFNTDLELGPPSEILVVDVDRALDTPGTKRCYSVRLRSFRDVQYYSDAYDWTLELYGDLGQILSPGLELESPNLIIVIGGSLSHADKSLKLNCRMGSDESKIIHFVRNGEIGPGEEATEPYGSPVNTNSHQMIYYYTSDSAQGTILRTAPYLPKFDLRKLDWPLPVRTVEININNPPASNNSGLLLHQPSPTPIPNQRGPSVSGPGPSKKSNPPPPPPEDHGEDGTSDRDPDSQDTRDSDQDQDRVSGKRKKKNTKDARPKKKRVRIVESEESEGEEEEGRNVEESRRVEVSKSKSPYAYHTLKQCREDLAVAEGSVPYGMKAQLLKRNIYGVVLNLVKYPMYPFAKTFRIWDETVVDGVYVRIHQPRRKQPGIGIGPKISQNDIIRIHRATVQEEFVGLAREMVISTSPHQNYTIFSCGPVKSRTLAEKISFHESDLKRVMELREEIVRREELNRSRGDQVNLGNVFKPLFPPPVPSALSSAEGESAEPVLAPNAESQPGPSSSAAETRAQERVEMDPGNEAGAGKASAPGPNPDPETLQEDMGGEGLDPLDPNQDGEAEAEPLSSCSVPQPPTNEDQEGEEVHMEVEVGPGTGTENETRDLAPAPGPNSNPDLETLQDEIGIGREGSNPPDAEPQPGPSPSFSTAQPQPPGGQDQEVGVERNPDILAQLRAAAVEREREWDDVSMASSIRSKYSLPSNAWDDDDDEEPPPTPPAQPSYFNQIKDLVFRKLSFTRFKE